MRYSMELYPQWYSTEGPSVVLHSTTLHYTVILHRGTPCGTPQSCILSDTPQRYTMWYSTALYYGDTPQRYPVWYCTELSYSDIPQRCSTVIWHRAIVC